MTKLVQQFLVEFPELKEYFAGTSVEKHGDSVILEKLPIDHVARLVSNGWVRSAPSSAVPENVSYWRHSPAAGSFTVAPSDLEGISEPPEKKAINVITTGRLSKGTHDKIIGLLRREPVELKFLPSFVELLPDEHQEPVSVSLQACDIFTEIADSFLSASWIHINEAINDFGTRENLPVLAHLADRLMTTPQHITLIHREEPFFSYIDTSSLNRSNFEAAVTLLYFLNDSENNALKSLCRSSLEADYRRRKEIEKWISDSDPAVSTSARCMLDYFGKEADSLETAKMKMGVDQSKPLPSVAGRCEIAGPIWQVLYTSRYRQFCSWSHIHMENVLNAPGPTFSGMRKGDEVGLKESIARGITMVHFSWHLIYLLSNSLSKMTGVDPFEIKEIHLNAMGQLDSLLEKSSIPFTKSFMSTESEE